MNVSSWTGAEHHNHGNYHYWSRHDDCLLVTRCLCSWLEANNVWWPCSCQKVSLESVLTSCPLRQSGKSKGRKRLLFLYELDSVKKKKCKKTHLYFASGLIRTLGAGCWIAEGLRLSYIEDKTNVTAARRIILSIILTLLLLQWRRKRTETEYEVNENDW